MAGRVRGGGAGDLFPKKVRARSRPLQSSRTCTSGGAATRPLSTPLELALVADPLRAGLFARIPKTPKGPAEHECCCFCANLETPCLRPPFPPPCEEGVGNGGRRRLE